jgi:hypothetical protein
MISFCTLYVYISIDTAFMLSSTASVSFEPAYILRIPEELAVSLSSGFSAGSRAFCAAVS